MYFWGALSASAAGNASSHTESSLTLTRLPLSIGVRREVSPPQHFSFFPTQQRGRLLTFRFVFLIYLCFDQPATRSSSAPLLSILPERSIRSRTQMHILLSRKIRGRCGSQYVIAQIYDRLLLAYLLVISETVNVNHEKCNVYAC